MAKYEKVGGGSYGVYRKKDSVWPKVFIGIIALVVLAAVFGGKGEADAQTLPPPVDGTDR